MRLGEPNFPQTAGTGNKEFDAWVTAVESHITELSQAVNGRLTFGDGVDADNFKALFKTFTSNAAPNTEETILHDMGEIPIGYLVIKQDKAGSLYSGGTAWTTQNIYLKSSVASTTYTILILYAP